MAACFPCYTESVWFLKMNLPKNENNSRQKKCKLLIIFFPPASGRMSKLCLFFFLFSLLRPDSFQVNQSGCIFQTLQSPQWCLHPQIVSKMPQKSQFWQVTTLPDPGAAGVKPTSDGGFGVRRGNLWGHKWIAHPVQRQHWQRPHSSRRCLTAGWEGDILGAQAGCTLHTKGHVGRDLHWEQNQGPAIANPGLCYLSCTSQCFLASPGLLLLCRSV